MKTSTYIFATAVMAVTFMAIKQEGYAHEHKAHAKAGATAMMCCKEGKTTATKTSASAKKASAPMACCMKKEAAAKTAKSVAKASLKTTSAKTEAKACCLEAGKKL